MNRSRVFLILSLAALTATIFGFRERLEASSAPEAQAPEVQVTRPTIAPIQVSRKFPGVLEAIDRAALHSQVTGYLESIAYEEGALVRKGSVLFRIDSRAYRARLAEATAALALARSEAELARSESERAGRLVERQALAVEEALRRHARAEMAASNVNAAEAALNAARLQVEFTEIRAPFDGRIGRARVTVGNLVTPADELAVLVSLDELHVRFDIDEQSAGEIGRGGSDAWWVHFEIPGQDARWTGPVTIIGNEVLHGTVRLHARISNEQHILVPGMYGQAELVTGFRPDALLIDEQSIGTHQRQRYVLLVNDAAQVEFRPVTVGGLHGQFREIIDGVSRQDRILTNGLMRVRPGTEVIPVEVPPPAFAFTESSSPLSPAQ